MRHTDKFSVRTLRKLLSTAMFYVLNKDNPHNNKVQYERTSNFKSYILNTGKNSESILEK